MGLALWAARRVARGGQALRAADLTQGSLRPGGPALPPAACHPRLPPPAARGAERGRGRRRPTPGPGRPAAQARAMRSSPVLIPATKCPITSLADEGRFVRSGCDFIPMSAREPVCARRGQVLGVSCSSELRGVGGLVPAVGAWCWHLSWWRLPCTGPRHRGWLRPWCLLGQRLSEESAGRGGFPGPGGTRVGLGRAWPGRRSAIAGWRPRGWTVAEVALRSAAAPDTSACSGASWAHTSPCLWASCGSPVGAGSTLVSRTRTPRPGLGELPRPSGPVGDEPSARPSSP